MTELSDELLVALQTRWRRRLLLAAVILAVFAAVPIIAMLVMGELRDDVLPVIWGMAGCSACVFRARALTPKDRPLRGAEHWAPAKWVLLAVVVLVLSPLLAAAAG